MPLFSGEPLPIPPLVQDVELDSFHRKLIDYLRRLTGKFDAFAADPPEPPEPEPSNNVESFVAFLTTDLTTSTAFQTVNFGTLLWRDAVYERVGSAVEVQEPGLYIIMVDLYLEDGTISWGEAQIKFTSPGSVVWYLHFGSSRTVGSATMSICVPVVLVANVRFEVELRTDTDGLPGLMREGTRITVLRVRDNAGGGTGGDAPGWDDDDMDNVPDTEGLAQL